MIVPEAFFLCRRHCPFDHRLPVKVGCPVDQVERPEKNRKHYPGHLVNLADAVVSLFRVDGSLCLAAFQLHGRAVGNGRDGRILGDVWSVVYAGRAGIVGLLGERQGILSLQRTDERRY